MDKPKDCYCQSGKAAEDCCLPILEGRIQASSPEALMRSRYTAFCLENIEYLQQTTDPAKQESFDLELNKSWASKAEFTGLEILASEEMADTGRVEFKASFDFDGESRTHHEDSVFKRIGGRWYFHSGEVFEEDS
ncbi:zinc chelation protein SecC [bacterium]|nr:zinc chelation protein SecC [bacterium]